MNTWLHARTNRRSADAQRMFVGSDAAKNAILNMRDRQGKPRLRLVVDSLGGARIEFLDVNGNVTNTINGSRSGSMRRTATLISACSPARSPAHSERIRRSSAAA